MPAAASDSRTAAVTSFDTEIAPNLRKLERLTGAVIRFPWLGRQALAGARRCAGATCSRGT
jgi:hypothetical protein